MAAARDAAAGLGAGGGSGLVGCTFDSLYGESAAGLGGFGLGIGLVLELDAGIFDINIGSGAVKIGLEGAFCIGVHNHDTQVGTIGSVSAVRVAGKGIALGTGQDIQIAAEIAFAAESSPGNIRTVFRRDLGIRGVGDDARTADAHIGSFQFRHRALIIIVVEPCGDVDIVLCLHAAAGDIGFLFRRNGGIHIADQQLIAGNADLGRVNGGKRGCGSVADDLNAVAAAANRPSCSDTAARDGRSVGSARIRVRQIHLTADKAHADLGLLRSGLGPGVKVASDTQGSRIDRAPVDLCREGTVRIRIHADRADIHQAQFDVFVIFAGHGIRLGIASGVAEDGNRTGGDDVRAGDGGFTHSHHFRRYGIDLGAVAGSTDGTGGGAAQNGNRALRVTVVELAGHGNGAGIDHDMVQLCLLFPADLGGERVNHSVVQGNIGLLPNLGQGLRGAVRENGNGRCVDG